jgi:(p)ppGpp synthase/HD superfamily hydrolase
VTVDGEDRAAAMAASVRRTARSFGVDPEGVALLSLAHALAMEPRMAALDDDHHPLYLHPGRTVLVLLRDAYCVDGTVLAAAALTESEDGEFRIGDAAVLTSVGRSVADILRVVPDPRSESLAEELLMADGSVRLVALAERLDHLRHAHLRDADAEWRRTVHAQAESVYLPMAERTHARLAQRYRHWCRTFARRLDHGP